MKHQFEYEGKTYKVEFFEIKTFKGTSIARAWEGAVRGHVFVIELKSRQSTHLKVFVLKGGKRKIPVGNKTGYESHKEIGQHILALILEVELMDTHF